MTRREEVAAVHTALAALNPSLAAAATALVDLVYPPPGRHGNPFHGLLGDPIDRRPAARDMD